MKITLYTDGSHDPRSKVGAFAWRALNERGKVIKTGVGYMTTHSINCVEARAISNALNQLREQHHGSEIHIHTDSDNLIRWIQDFSRKSKSKEFQSEIEIIRNLHSKGNFTLRITKVPAHKGIEHNEWCDKTAKEHLKVGIRHYEEQNKKGMLIPKLPVPSTTAQSTSSTPATISTKTYPAKKTQPASSNPATRPTPASILTIHASAKGRTWKVNLSNGQSYSGTGDTDNIDAIFQAIIHGIEQCPFGSHIKVTSNSINHENWLSGVYRAKQPRVVNWLEKITTAAQKRRITLNR